MLFELMGLRNRLMQIWRIESRNHPDSHYGNYNDPQLPF